MHAGKTNAVADDDAAHVCSIYCSFLDRNVSGNANSNNSRSSAIVGTYMGKCWSNNATTSGPFKETKTCMQNPLSCCAAASGECCCCCCRHPAAAAVAAGLSASTSKASYNIGSRAPVAGAASGPKRDRSRRNKKMHAGRNGGRTSKFAPSTSSMLPWFPAACQHNTQASAQSPTELDEVVDYLRGHKRVRTMPAGPEVV